MAAKLVFKEPGEALAKHIRALKRPIERAVTKTVKDAAALIKKESISAIAGAGFSARSSKNLRYAIEPENKDTIDVSARFYFRTGYFNVFEEGTTIKGKPLLWVPLPTVPFGKGRRRLTPRQYVERLGPLHYVRGKKNPLLVGAASRSGVLRATLDVVRVRKRAVAAGAIRTGNVPLYVGLKSVRIPKKFNIKEIIRRVAAMIPKLYAKNAEAEKDT